MTTNFAMICWKRDVGSSLTSNIFYPTRTSCTRSALSLTANFCVFNILMFASSLVAVGSRRVPLTLDPHQSGKPEPVYSHGNDEERVQEDSGRGKSTTARTIPFGYSYVMEHFSRRRWTNILAQAVSYSVHEGKQFMFQLWVRYFLSWFTMGSVRLFISCY